LKARKNPFIDQPRRPRRPFISRSGKILFINPNLMKPVVTPVAIDYLAQAMEEKGFTTEILDLAFGDDPEKELERYLGKCEYLLIALTVRNIDDSYFASQDFCLQRTKVIIDQIRGRTEAPLVLGGVGFSIRPESALSYCGVEMGVKGDGEWSLPQLAERLLERGDLRNIPGVIFKKKENYHHNPVRYGSLNSLCLSRREALDHPRYLREGGMVGFETKRGCDQKCIYCADPLSKGRIIRWRNPQDVAAELAHLYQKGVDHFHTCDSEFNLPASQAIEVCKEIAKERLNEKIRWYAYASATPFEEELASWMERAGCVGIDFGVDHGNDEMLRRLGRAHNAAAIENTARLARKHGFALMFDLLLGGPGETRETIRETIELMKRASPDRVGISLGVRLYRGTALAQKVVREEGFGLKNKNLHGAIRGNEEMLQPIFYLSAGLGEDVEEFIEKQIAGDPRFLLGSRKNVERNYNYNENSRLTEAIKQGYRGAFWDILRRMGNG
jgi:radical SAM superfamily enzyme YgiQ (UPF0313 family)